MKESHALVVSASELKVIIDKLATQILADYSVSPLFVVLLRGGAPFASKLMFSITRQSPEFHPELDYMVVSTYGQDRSANEPVIVTDVAPDTSLSGRDVVIIDDVIDQGITSDFVRNLLYSRGAASIKLAALVNKKVQGRTSQADYVGLEASDQWLIGMGLDDAKSGHEHYRWSDSIWQISK